MRLETVLFLTQSIFCVGAMVGERVRRARDNEFPYVVSIKIINNRNKEPENDHGCTGTVLSAKDVLTVAHGFEGVPMLKIEVVVGSTDIRQGRKYHPFELITYDSWVKRKRNRMQSPNNDIAILKIAEALPASIRAPNLLYVHHADLVGRDVVTAGWGKTMANKKSRYMETMTVQILSSRECYDRIIELTGKPSVLNQRYICTAAVPFAFLRTGDSGGPLLLNGQLLGINKASSPLREDQFNPKKVNIHISIFPYKDFLTDILP